MATIDPNDPNRVARVGGKNAQPRVLPQRWASETTPKPADLFVLPASEKSPGNSSQPSGLFPPTVTGL